MNIQSCVQACLRLTAISAISFNALLSVAAMPNSAQVEELIILYDQESLDLPLTAEQIVSAVNLRIKDPQSLQIVQKFGGPASARPLIRERMDPAQRSDLKSDDPQERLQRYVVLAYGDPLTAEFMLKSLKEDPSVISVEENAFLEFFALPNDPLSSPGVGEGYQWGYTALNWS